MGSLLHKRIPTPIALVIILAAVVTAFWLVSMRRMLARPMPIELAYEAALAEYAMQHAGRLPPSIRTPDVRLPGRSGKKPQAQIEEAIARLERLYDVAWGTQASEVDASGFVASRQRFLIQPAAQSPVSVEACERLSRDLAMKMKQIAATSSSPK